MALFGSTDEYVPVLTAFYQAVADYQNPLGSELDVLMLRYEGNIPHTRQMWSDVPLDGNLYIDSEGNVSPVNDEPIPAEIREQRAQALRRLAAIHPVIVRLMNASADGTLPQSVDIWQFNKELEQTITAPRLSVNGSLNSPISGGQTLQKRYGENRFTPAPVGNVGLVVSYPIPRQENAMEEQILTFEANVLSGFLKACEGRGFVRCEECQSAFGVNRAGIRFCSKRCAIRSGTRKRRAVKKVAA